MIRFLPAVLVAWAALYAAVPAQAQWVTRMQTAGQRNRAWPEPFLMPDRQATCMPFAIMVANGWRRSNLMSDYHFNEETQQLTAAGEAKLRFILTQMPPQRRTVFVQRGLMPDVTAARIAEVEQASLKVVPPGLMATVVESDLPNDGWPADEVDGVARRYRATAPEPRLQNVSGADSSSAGAGNSN
jgi:hypothetical protein